MISHGSEILRNGYYIAPLFSRLRITSSTWQRTMLVRIALSWAMSPLAGISIDQRLRLRSERTSFWSRQTPPCHPTGRVNEALASAFASALASFSASKVFDRICALQFGRANNSPSCEVLRAEKCSKHARLRLWTQCPASPTLPSQTRTSP